MDLKYDNPNSRYHYQYQRSVNRIFSIVVILMCIVLNTFFYGVMDTIQLVVSVGMAFLAVFLVLYVISFVLFEILPDFVEWLKGE